MVQKRSPLSIHTGNDPTATLTIEILANGLRKFLNFAGTVTGQGGLTLDSPYLSGNASYNNILVLGNADYTGPTTMKKIDARKLPREAQEEMRRQAMRLREELNKYSICLVESEVDQLSLPFALWNRKAIRH